MKSYLFVLSLRTLLIENDLSSCCNVCLLLLLFLHLLILLGPHIGLPTVGLFTFFSYEPLCLYPETYPDVSTMSSRPAFPFPRPDGSKRSLCEPVNLEVSVSRLTVGEATALCGGGCSKEEVRVHLPRAEVSGGVSVCEPLP